jgi:macrolide-specific efflux system membrane fusion protein
MSTKNSSKKPWIILSLIAIAAVFALGGWYYKRLSAPPKTQYKEHKPERGDLEVFVQATGQVQPENRLIVKPAISGRIESVLSDEGRTIKAGDILAWMSSNDRAALLDMAKAKGSQEVDHWAEIYKPSPIIAPLSGVIIAKGIEPGQVVATSDTAFVISDRLIISAQVDETDLARVKMGQDCLIQLDAYREQETPGKVVRIAYEARQANNVTVYDIRVLPKAVPDFMRSGMTASVKFIETTRTNVLKLPVSLFKKTLSAKELKKPGSESTVLIKAGEVDKEPTTTEKKITLGATDGRDVEVVSGLEDSDVILEDVTPEDTKSSNPFSPFGGKNPGKVSGRNKK